MAYSAGFSNPTAKPRHRGEAFASAVNAAHRGADALVPPATIHPVPCVGSVNQTM